jgi:Tfp pilus assembly protein PilZ
MTDDRSFESSSLDRHYRCALAVALKRRGGDAEVLTSQVSFGGVFVRIDQPPPLGSLVRIVLTLPDEANLAVSAHTTEIVDPVLAPDRYPGFFAKFLAFSGSPKERWEGFVQTLSRDRVDLLTTTLVLARPSYVERFRRNNALAVDVPFRPMTVQELSLIVGMEVLNGSLFVPTELGLMVGANVNVQLVHPLSEQVFPLLGNVIGRKTTGVRGVDVAFAPISSETREGLLEFVDSVLLIQEYDIDVLTGPLLARTR